MSIANDLRKVKQEHEMALQAERAARLGVTARPSALEDAGRCQHRALVANWSVAVKEVLFELGKATWGEEGFALIEPDDGAVPIWYAAHVEGGVEFNYRLELRMTGAVGEGLALSPADALVRPLGFIVRGVAEYSVAPDLEALNEATIAAFKSGPGRGGLDPSAEAKLARIPYGVGEYDAPHKWLAAAMVATILSGLGAFVLAVVLLALVLPPSMQPHYTFAFDPKNTVTGDPRGDFLVFVGALCLLASIGAALIALACAGLRRTHRGKRFRRLGAFDKTLAVAAAMPGALLAMVLSGGLIAIVLAAVVALGGLATTSARNERVGEIEEGVRRALW